MMAFGNPAVSLTPYGAVQEAVAQTALKVRAGADGIYTETGKNYNLIENYNTGVATWNSAPERIFDGVYTDFIKSEDSNFITFESMSSSYKFNKNTCVLDDFGAGKIGNKAVKKTLSHDIKEANNNGNSWRVASVNSSTCDVSYTTNDKGIQIISTKSNVEDILTQNGTNVNGTATFDVTGSTGGIFTTIYDIDYSSGFEWTFEYTNLDDTKTNHKYGFTTVVNSNEHTLLDGIKVNNGVVKGKPGIVGNNQSIKIGNTHLDFKNEQHDSTWALKKEVGKTILDFTDAKGALLKGEKLVVDPTLTTEGDGTFDITSLWGAIIASGTIDAVALTGGQITALQADIDATNQFHTLAGTTLIVSFTLPIPPSIPTNDGVTDGVDLTYDWTYGLNSDDADQPAITSSSVYVGDTGYPYAPLANWNATQDSKYGGIDTSSNFDGLFHFDTLYTSNELGSANFTDYSGDDNHGTITNLPSLASLTYDFSDSVGYSTTGTKYAISGGTMTHTGATDSSRMYVTLPVTLKKADGYSIDFETNVASINTDANACVYYLTSDDTAPLQCASTGHGNTDGIFVGFQRGGSANKWITLGTNNNGVETTALSGTDWSTSTTYYQTLNVNSTGVGLTVYSDSARTTPLSGMPISLSLSGIDDLVVQQHVSNTANANSITVSIDNIVYSYSGTGTTTIETSSIDTGFSNEVQFTNSGLNITSTSFPELQQAWTVNGLVTLNQIDPLTLLSFDSGSEVKITMDNEFIDLTKGGSTIFNHTLTTALAVDTPQAITIKRSSTGIYETFINGTRSPDSSTTDTTTLGTVTNDLYHIGFDTLLAGSSTWRLDELSILSIEQSAQDTLDFGNRIVPFTYQATVSAPTTTYSHTGLALQTDKCFNVTIWNSVGEGDVSGTECGKTIDPTPSQPTGLIATASSDSVIGLDWDDSVIPTIDNITGYRIFSESPTGNGWTLEVNDTASSTSSYSDTGLTTKTQYNYMVAGINATGIGSNSTASADYTWGVPDPITGFTIINPTSTTLDPN